MERPDALLGITGLISLSICMVMFTYIMYGLNSYLIYGVADMDMNHITDENLDRGCVNTYMRY